MNAALLIARRIDLRGSRRRGSGPGVVIAVAGIALALTVMMISVAVMQGFKKEIRAKVTGFESQLTVNIASENADEFGGETDVATDATPVRLTPELKAIIAETLPGPRAAIAASRPGVLKTDTDFAGVVFSTPSDSIFVASHVVDGKMPDYSVGNSENDIILSASMMRTLGLSGPGEKIGAYFFSNGGIKARRFTVAGVYDTHLTDYDASVVYASPAMIARLDRLGADAGTRIDINGLPSDALIEPSAKRLQDALLTAYYDRRLPELYRVDNAHRRGAVYFNWLELLDTNVAVILALMAAVSAFTLISSLFIIILERVNMIGILKAIGASNSLVRRTFIIVAERLVVRGLVIGNLVSLGLIALQAFTHILPLDADTYYLNYVPVSIGWLDVLALNAGVIVMAALVLLLPSHIVATISPARSIRYD